jgi:hypothetical protein
LLDCEPAGLVTSLEQAWLNSHAADALATQAAWAHLGDAATLTPEFQAVVQEYRGPREAELRALIWAMHRAALTADELREAKHRIRLLVDQLGVAVAEQIILDTQARLAISPGGD